MKKIKSFLQIRTSVVQSDCPLPRMLPLSYTRQYTIIKTTSLTLSRHIGIGPARLYQFVCSGGRHFPPKINDDCLPWLLSPSSFYGSGWKLTEQSAHDMAAIHWASMYSIYMMYPCNKPVGPLSPLLMMCDYSIAWWRPFHLYWYGGLMSSIICLS